MQLTSAFSSIGRFNHHRFPIPVNIWKATVCFYSSPHFWVPRPDAKSKVEIASKRNEFNALFPNDENEFHPPTDCKPPEFFCIPNEIPSILNYQFIKTLKITMQYLNLKQKFLFSILSRRIMSKLVSVFIIWFNRYTYLLLYSYCIAGL